MLNKTFETLLNYIGEKLEKFMHIEWYLKPLY
jgi:hypothetical protein